MDASSKGKGTSGTRSLTGCGCRKMRYLWQTLAAICLLALGGMVWSCSNVNKYDESKYERKYEGYSEERLKKIIDDNPSNLEAYAELGRHYMELGWSDTITQDKYWALGCENFKRAGERGHAIAQYNVGVCYINGWGVEKDENEAYKWWMMGASQGYPSAEAAVGKCHFNGWGVPKDEKEAMKWWRKAADSNDIDGMVAMAYSYFMGTGVEKDNEEGLKWAQKAADLGDDSALMYYKYVVIGDNAQEN
ncbi:MAG: sel1 repeat family protein [Muribaculaceae bacterium]|nr:sel1 repeat family protein [Muribaculaceae bacterium]